MFPEPPTASAPAPADRFLVGERVAFTGTLASMTHRQAAELVEQHGGETSQHVTHTTTLVVVGEEGWPLESDGLPSQKLERALDLQQRGCPVRTMPESDFLKMLGLQHESAEIRRTYTPAMLSTLLGIPVREIRRWERAGLIRPVRRVFRLPYFDFQEVTGVRRLSELLSANVSPRDLEAGLKRLINLMPGIERPLSQLSLLVADRKLLYVDSRGLVEPKSGQRHFTFDPADLDGTEEALETPAPTLRLVRHDEEVRWSADELYRDGCQLSDDGDLPAAIEMFRLALMERGGDPEINFHLADTLYRSGRPDAALERYFAVVEHDHEFIEAWTQIGCLMIEAGKHDDAIEALEIAIDVFPDYPDAHHHLARALDLAGRPADARKHWERYLDFDQCGPWAEVAMQRLERDDDDAPITVPNDPVPIDSAD